MPCTFNVYNKESYLVFPKESGTLQHGYCTYTNRRNWMRKVSSMQIYSSMTRASSSMYRHVPNLQINRGNQIDALSFYFMLLISFTQ
ncbi:hypothetical protein RchiOBHm_Chr1g0381831 [Rosa chinensis]|uniref:Uncharacterized protein n=1 Tax=Rosa chinensis TaxID=74649 RepID=A0A2P6SP93_ROSCH|nr:hypothetical protein RchiOBHm_Chr1g0381831 [Rosa chinensis]